MLTPGISLASVPKGTPFPPPVHCHPVLTSPGRQAFSFSPVVVAEVTQPSLGVGYELGRAVALGKQILCLFRPQSGRGEYPSLGWLTPSWLSGNPILVSSFPRGLGQGAEWGAWKEGSFICPLPSAFCHDPGSSRRLEVPGVGLCRGRAGEHD